MGRVSRRMWSALALALLVAPASIAGAVETDSDPDVATATVTSHAEQPSPNVDQGLVEEIAAAHPYPETPEEDPDQRTDAQIATWNQEITEYWRSFPYDEVAAAYGCEIRDLEVGEAEDGTPSRSLVVGDCPTPEHTQVTLETMDQISTASAEAIRSLAGPELTSSD